ncbi:hypothetical protein DL767_000025 [Monosporascus sp. MG133]|nr:hypothetical protein DL767_000025 [Monosporascus sp. MG133]
MSLRERLIERKQQGFITVRDLEELITPSAVQQLLSHNNVVPVSQADQDALARALPRARKLVAILVLGQLERHILDVIVAHSTTDGVFPIEDWQVVPPLNADESRRVCREQWAVPPVLRREEHLQLPRGATLPFSSKESVNHGSFGIVYKVKVADGHLDSDMPPGRSKPLVIALKEVEVEEGREDDFMREVVANRRRRHPNLVPLLASYTERRAESGCETVCISMLFPYAELDMEAWLYLCKTPTNLACLSTSEQRLRLYAMAARLVSALTALHKEVGGFVASHHDLKPRNILVVGEDLMIADLGMSNLVRLDRTDGSGVRRAGGLGTRSYRPPEYYKEGGGWERDETRAFGRSFDMWAMGCIMIQIAVLVVWGWESGKMREFRKARERIVAQDQQARGAVGKRSFEPDDSFVKSIPEVDKWLTLLQEEDGSAMLRGYLAVAIQMLRQDPSDRIYSWEAELHLHELLHPDEPRAARLSMTSDLAQQPTPGQATNRVETPLHRAVAQGNLIRTVGLLEAGWPADQRDKTGRTSSEIASHNGQLHLRDLLSRAESIRKFGGKHALRDVALEPAIQIKDQRGFRLQEGSWQRGAASHALQGEVRGGVAGSIGARESQGPGHTPEIMRNCLKFGRTRLHEAAQRGDVALLGSLLNDADASEAVLLVDDLGKSPLHYAAETSADGVTAILRAATHKTQLLLARDQYGRNPLHLAVESGKRDVVEVLLKACHDGVEARRMLYQEDQEGAIPLGKAEAAGRGDLVRILEEAQGHTA